MNNNQQPFSKKVWTASGIIAFVIIMILLLKTLFSVLLLTFAGIILAVYFIAFGGMLHKYLKCPEKYSVLIAVIINVLLLVAFFWFTGSRLQQQVAELSNTLPATIQNAKEQIGQSTLGQKVLNVLNNSGDNQKTMKVAKRLFSSSFGILSDCYIILLMGLFFTASPQLYRKGLISLLPKSAQNKARSITNDLYDVITKWLLGTIIGFFFIAIFTGIGLLIIGMPLILTPALIAGLLNIIPNFGPIIALIPAVLLALMQGITTAIIIVCVYTFIQIIQSSVTQPIIQKKMVSIPPALTIFGQVALGLLGGFWGVLLAAPIVAVIKKTITELYLQPKEDSK